MTINFLFSIPEAKNKKQSEVKTQWLSRQVANGLMSEAKVAGASAVASLLKTPDASNPYTGQNLTKVR